MMLWRKVECADLLIAQTVFDSSYERWLAFDRKLATTLQPLLISLPTFAGSCILHHVWFIF